MNEHTPTPWHAGFPDGSGENHVTTIREYEYSHPGFAKVDDPPGRVTLRVDPLAPRRHYSEVAEICEMSDDQAISRTEREANANFIVRAVNAHESLLAALKAVEWVPTGEDGEGEEQCPSCGDWKHRGHAPDCQLAAALRKGENG